MGGQDCIELDASDFLKLKRGCWVIECRLHHALDVTLRKDHSRVRNPKDAFALSLFRRLVVSSAQVWVTEGRKVNPKSRATTRKFQQRFRRDDGGREHVRPLVRQIACFLALNKLKRCVLRARGNWSVPLALGPHWCER